MGASSAARRRATSMFLIWQFAVGTIVQAVPVAATVTSKSQTKTNVPQALRKANTLPQPITAKIITDNVNDLKPILPRAKKQNNFRPIFSLTDRVKLPNDPQIQRRVQTCMNQIAKYARIHIRNIWLTTVNVKVSRIIWLKFANDYKCNCKVTCRQTRVLFGNVHCIDYSSLTRVFRCIL
jgi:hypothetical protein